MQQATQATPVAAAPVAANNAVATAAPTAPTVEIPAAAAAVGLPPMPKLVVIAQPPMFERICTGVQTVVVTAVGGVVLYDRFFK